MVGVLEQYPHYLYRDTEDGWVYVGRCREETNGKGGHIRTADMEVYTFSSIVQMPAGTPKIPEGVEIAVLEKPSEMPNGPSSLTMSLRILGTCAKFDPGRLHCRMWV